jgi:hypothetical protein
VRLVDDEQGDLHAARAPREVADAEALGRHVAELQPATDERLDAPLALLPRQQAVDAGRRDAALPQGLDLVLHQRDQRAHDERRALEQERRQLVAERFALPGRHQRERVPAEQQPFDDLFLQASERREAEVLLELGLEVVGHGGKIGRPAAHSEAALGSQVEVPMGQSFVTPWSIVLLAAFAYGQALQIPIDTRPPNPSPSSSPNGYVSLGSVVYFAATADASRGGELWRSDGTGREPGS